MPLTIRIQLDIKTNSHNSYNSQHKLIKSISLSLTLALTEEDCGG